LQDESKGYGQKGKYLHEDSEFASCFTGKRADVSISYTWSTTLESLLGKLEEFERGKPGGLTYFLDILFVGKSHIF
jgi:hypothetical protein